MIVRMLPLVLLLSLAIALWLLVGYVRRRRHKALMEPSADHPILINIPDYLDDYPQIKVPVSKLQDDDRPFYAVRLGPITLITKIYWRIVHY